MEKYYVYEWIRLDYNEPFYVGKGKENRCYNVDRRNKHFKDIITFCQNNEIEVAVSILEDNLEEECAYQYECWYINLYVTEYGYNITNKTWGGEGGDIVSCMSQEEKKRYSEKMRKSCLGKNKGHCHTEEAKLRMSLSKKGRYIGENNPMYGKSIKEYMSEQAYQDWKRKISLSQKGRRVSDETRNKISKVLTGRVRSEDIRKKFSEINLGEGNPMYGRHHTEEAKKLIARGNQKKVKVQFKGGEELVFDSRNSCIKYFYEEYNVGVYTIKKLLSTGEVLDSKYKKFKEINGLAIYYID